MLNYLSDWRAVVRARNASARILLLILISANSFYFQTKNVPTSCFLSQSPQLRGFYLGQTVQDINSVIPTFESTFEKWRLRSLRPEFLDVSAESGYFQLTDLEVFSGRSEDIKFQNKDFKDVQFNWHIFDGKLMSIAVTYTEFEPPSLRYFVRQLSEKAKLPTTGWVYKDKTHAELKCIGFTVDVYTGRDVKRLEYRGFPSVILTDYVTVAELRKRENAIRLRKKNEEIERVRREREKKTTLRP